VQENNSICCWRGIFLLGRRGWGGRVLGWLSLLLRPRCRQSSVRDGRDTERGTSGMSQLLRCL